MSSTNFLRFTPILALVLATAHVNAATLYLRWNGESGNTIELAHLGEADVEVWIDLVDGDTLSGVFFANTATNGLRQVGTAVNLTDWSDGSVDDLLGGPEQFVSFGSVSTNGNLTTAGSYLLGTQTIRLETCIVDQPLPVTIDHGTLWVLEEDAGQPKWDARYNTSYSGYVAYGDYGNPGWGSDPGRGHQPTPNPLYVACDVDTQGVQPRTTTSNGLIPPRTDNAPPIDVEALGTEVCGCTDLVFLVDITVSMNDAIGSIAGTNGLREVINVADVRAGSDLRVGLITFTDTVTVNHPLTTNISAVEATIAGLSTVGGADDPEASDEALREMLDETECLQGAQRFDTLFRGECIKYAVVITDNLPGGCDDAFSPVVESNAHQRAVEARAAGAMILAVYPTDAASQQVVDIMQDYAATTGGAYIQAEGDGIDIATHVVTVIDACPDCNSNGVNDLLDVNAGTSTDCNSNGRPDVCELTDNDCNANTVPDDCEIAAGLGSRFFVDVNVVGGAQTGISWSDAFPDLQDALAVVAQANCPVSEIWVADGTYFPGMTYPDTIELVNGLAIYGGFAGDETALNERDISANETVLSGDISQFGTDSVHVVTALTGVDATAVLDGFTIRGGRATVSAGGDLGSGAGLFVETGATPVIRNCTFTDNLANSEGGAAYVKGDALFEDCTFDSNTGATGGAVYALDCAPKFNGCTFELNSAGASATGGGAIYATSITSNGVIDRCTFIDNLASGSGGGIFLEGSDPTISNSFFGSNGAEGFFGGGGGIGIFIGSAPTLVNNVFSGNIADFGGGVDLYSNSTATIVNCSFFGNTARVGSGGGGLDNSQSLGTSVVNSVFWENVADGNLHQIAQADGTSLTTSLRISHSNVQGGENAISSCSGCPVDYQPSNKDADPLFIDPSGPDGHEGSIDDNLRLTGGSPCENAGSNGAVVGIDTDADGFDRIAFGTVDMGAYEIFVDCNTNDLADVAELMDANTNGVVDLEDYQHFQLCINDTGPACLALFDRALACGVVDLADFDVFERQLTGPPAIARGGGAQAKVLLSPKKRKTGGAWYAKILDDSPDIQTAALAFELQPVGGDQPVTTLAPHTAYELHYTAQAEAVSCYFLYAASASAGSGLDLITPAVTGPWSDDRLFDFVDESGELALAPNHPGIYRTDSAIDLHFFGPKEKGDAPSTGQACTITTGDSGELTLDFHMFGRPREEGQPVVVMEASATFTVQGP